MEGRFGVLIVEDDLIQLTALKKAVELLNHTVLGTTMFGECAVDLVDELNPDIIFMDIALAGTMSGIKAAQIINTKSNAAIFYVTGNTWAKDDEGLKSSTFIDILNKPIAKNDIQAAILEYVAGLEASGGNNLDREGIPYG